MKLSEYQVKCRTKVSDIGKAKQLNVWGCQLSDVNIISQMPKMEILGLGNNCVTTLKSLKNCHKLQELYLGENQIASFVELYYLKEAKSLTKLAMNENPKSHSPSVRAAEKFTPTRDSKRGARRCSRNPSVVSVRSNTGSMVLKLSVQQIPEQSPGNSNRSNGDRITCTCRDKTCGNAVSLGHEQEHKDAIARLYPVDASRKDMAEQQHRNANLLKSSLVLVKEMDASSLEILQRAIRDQMRKLST